MNFQSEFRFNLCRGTYFGNSLIENSYKPNIFFEIYLEIKADLWYNTFNYDSPKIGTTKKGMIINESKTSEGYGRRPAEYAGHDPSGTENVGGHGKIAGRA